MKRLIPALIVLMFLPGCGLTPQGDAIRQLIATKGAKAMDEALVDAEWVICEAASGGALQRRYGKSARLAEARRTLCLGDREAVIVKPE